MNSGLSCFWPERAAQKKRSREGESDDGDRKRALVSYTVKKGRGFFSDLPNDLVLLILSKLSSSANNPSDLINVMLTCRSLKNLATLPMVLSKVSKNGVRLKAKSWCQWAHRFLKRCIKAGNIESCYAFGMIYFYCLKKRKNGISLLEKAALECHPEALYSLAIIHFNGSGRSPKNLLTGIKLCIRAAYYSHIGALRELGFYFKNGIVVHQNIHMGCRLLYEANVKEITAVLGNGMRQLFACLLHSDCGCVIQTPAGHPANQFLVEWFAMQNGSVNGVDRVGPKMCSQGVCGRMETRRGEFLRCPSCGAVRYCSRACQAHHWKLAHKMECTFMNGHVEQAGGGGQGLNQ